VNEDLSARQMLRQLAKDLTPPIVVKAIRRLPWMRRPAPIPAPPVQPAIVRPITMFSGDYVSFEAAAAASVGYDDEAPATSAANQLRRLLDSQPPDEIDGRFQQVHSALCVARDYLRKDTLSVLDIGGANGGYFFRMRALMPATRLMWQVVETPSIVAACAPLAGSLMTFSERIPSDKVFDVALISGTLQYLSRPFDALREATRSAEWTILTRVPTHRAPTKFMIQTVPDHIHKGSMPIHIFSIDDLTSALKANGKIELSWAVTLDDPAFVGMDISNFGYLVRSAAR
jgi:putative methyltransferase (TIGR04325 family)